MTTSKSEPLSQSDIISNLVYTCLDSSLCKYKYTYTPTEPIYRRNGLCNNNSSSFNNTKIINKSVRLPSSLYTMNLAGLNVYSTPNYDNQVNWNQMSDRLQGHIQPVNASSRGSSTKHSITRERPGSQTPGGIGCDIKHNSYDRYLNRLKGKTVKKGSGVGYYTNIINGCNC